LIRQVTQVRVAKPNPIPVGVVDRLGREQLLGDSTIRPTRRIDPLWRRTVKRFGKRHLERLQTRTSGVDQRPVDIKQ
jgi:hypothetical protein